MDEVAGTSTLLREYIWMDGMPVAVIEGGTTYYIRVDHIGRPIFATDSAANIVWEVNYLPFGGVESSSGTNIDLRFPGQWFQLESGLHQNWMRDYDPTTGRYMQADPLGLVDGASIYGYARQNPMRYVDRYGMDSTNVWNNTGGRPIQNGPTNGNWGGGCWSGGQYSCDGNPMGSAPPTDSADACYMEHDICYTHCPEGEACVRSCNGNLVDKLQELPLVSENWPDPPKLGTERASETYRNSAISMFEDVR